MSTQIAVMTDSTADIPQDLAARRHIYTIPMHIVWEGKDMRDRVDLDAETFYARLATAHELPTTSQPSLSELTEAYEQAHAETGAAAVCIVTLSSKLSGVYNAACEAAKLVDFPVHVIDSRTGSIAAGLIALGLADARDAGIGLTSRCVGGGIGNAPLLPIATALKQAGNRVTSILGARDKDKLEAATDHAESAIAARHGSGAVSAKIQAHIIVAMV